MKLTWFNLLILALSTHRTTRLIVEDTITDGWRKLVERHATVKLKNAQGEWLEVDKEKPWIWRKIYALTSCHWCVSVWAGGGTVALGHYQGSWFKYLAEALALSTLAGWGSRIG